MSTVWASATEVEVYAAALLLAWGTFLAADASGRTADPSHAARLDALMAYGFALAVPLHLSALAAAPAVALLAATPRDGPLAWRRLAQHLAAAAACAGAGSGRRWLVLAGVAVAVGCAVGRRTAAARPAWRDGVRLLAALAVGLTPVLVMLARARHDPVLNQGDPSTWSALADVVARRQYAPAPPWPRQAPWWLQLGNVVEWADWQVALGLAPRAPPSWVRTPLTVAFAALGLLGASWHRARDRRGWRALLALFACGTVGVAAYLNLRAGPSFGWGVLADDAAREARERDYFFALGFWTWGLWAGLGAVALARRALAAAPAAVTTGAGLALAAAPAALNWRVADRRGRPEAWVATAFAEALLASAPPRAVLLVGGDNDTYPLWYAQAARRTRRDVVTVTLPLLPAPWYRAELARRHRLLPAAAVHAWLGEPRTLAALAAAARAGGRPLAASLQVQAPARAALPGQGSPEAWTLAGLVRVLDAPRTAGAHVAAPAALRAADGAGVSSVDAPVTRRVAADVARRWPGLLDAPPRAGGDGTVRWALAQLACPRAVLVALHAVSPAAAPVTLPSGSLEATCNLR
ncbi:MAG TPA: DUF2723 domain-containing protein, partial [Gemmatirosa sp.]|nr:DUF2723 domain-containing protein [Gemmatirosa sp.]